MAIKDIKFPQKIEKQILEKKQKEIKADQPIEILLELVKENEIDPWSLNIIDVADKFLEKIEVMEKKDLEVTAKTLYCASILLRKKSDGLVEEEENEEETRENTWEPEIYNPQRQEPPQLELPARRESQRPATIIELMDELKKALKQEKGKEKKRKLRKNKEEEEKEKVKDLAHEEKIEEQIKDTYEEIKKNFRKKKKIKFSELIEIKTKSKIIEKFLSILFLANRDKIRLNQKEPYGDIIITEKITN